MKTFADFKRKLVVGVELHTHNHKFGDMGNRLVSIVQSNSFALKTTRDKPVTSAGMTLNPETGKNEWNKTERVVVDSWCMFPKASDTEISENSVIIFENNKSGREAILTYTFL